MSSKEIDRSHFTTFAASFGQWANGANASIRIEQRTAIENIGPDTHFHLVSPPPSPAGPANPPSDTAIDGTEPAGKRKKIDHPQAARGYRYDLHPSQGNGVDRNSQPQENHMSLQTA